MGREGARRGCAALRASSGGARRGARPRRAPTQRRREAESAASPEHTAQQPRAARRSEATQARTRDAHGAVRAQIGGQPRLAGASHDPVLQAARRCGEGRQRVGVLQQQLVALGALRQRRELGSERGEARRRQHGRRGLSHRSCARRPRASGAPTGRWPCARDTNSAAKRAAAQARCAARRQRAGKQRRRGCGRGGAPCWHGAGAWRRHRARQASGTNHRRAVATPIRRRGARAASRWLRVDAQPGRETGHLRRRAVAAATHGARLRCGVHGRSEERVTFWRAVRTGPRA